MGKPKAPEPPDLSALASATENSAKLWADVAREQLAWAKQTDTANRDLLEQVLGVQLPQLEAAFNAAQDDRTRYEQVFRPLEDNLIKEFQQFDTPQRREEEAARRIADVRTQFEAQRVNQQRELEDYGIDPSQTRGQALDLGFRAQEAATAALAANQGRKSIEEMGRALRGEAINIGRGLPAQVAQSQGIVNQTAGGAVGNATNVTGAGAGAYSSALGAGQLSQQGYGTAATIQNAGYQNALAQYNAKAQQKSGFWGGLGALGGSLITAGGANEGGIPGVFGFAEGGSVPEDGQALPTGGDRYPAMLSRDEYVVPADVVKRKGTEFFDKLLDKFKDGGEYEQKRKEEEAQSSAINYQVGQNAVANMPPRALPVG